MDISTELPGIKPSLLNRQKRRDKRLHEELIECGRHGGGARHKKSRQSGQKKYFQAVKMLDSVPVRENIRALAKTASPTTPSDNLEPLERWLASKVGKPWAEVYAELGKIANPDSMHGQHIRQHLWDYVTTKSWINEQGQLVITLQNGSVPNPKYMRTWHNHYMVHPLSGILEKMPGSIPEIGGPYPKKARWKKEKEKRRYKIRLGIDVGKQADVSGLEVSDWSCIRTRIKRLSKGTFMKYRPGSLLKTSGCFDSY